jgi:hypothetical protein
MKIPKGFRQKFFTSLSILLSVHQVACRFESSLPIDCHSLKILGTLVIFALVFSLWLYFKEGVIVYEDKDKNIKIKIFSDDLFEQVDSNLVIGMTDTFDTELGQIIDAKTIQGQFTSQIYGGNSNKLNQDLQTLLSSQHPNSGTIDQSKKQGNNTRYSIGTTVTLEHGVKKYFCVAYSHLDNQLHAKSSYENITMALTNLWKEVRKKSNNTKVSIPVIGSGLARINGMSYVWLIKTIIISYMTASKEANICPELHLIISKSDKNKIRWSQIKDFMENL